MSSRSRARAAKNRRDVDRGRGYFETSSPFETYDPGGPTPKTFSGLVDDSPQTSRGGFGSDYLSGEGVMKRLDPEQYDNPRGYPGLAMVTAGNEKSKITGTPRHSITHHMEGSAALARTGKKGA